MDPAPADARLAAAGDPAKVIAFARRVLEPVGGRLYDSIRAQYRYGARNWPVSPAGARQSSV